MNVDMNLVKSMGVEVGVLWAVIHEKEYTSIRELYPDIKLNNPPSFVRENNSFNCEGIKKYMWMDTGQTKEVIDIYGRSWYG